MAFMDDITTPLLLKDTKDANVDKAVGYSNKLRDHLHTHYGIFAAQQLPMKSPGTGDISSPFSALDMIYYHVYGDYRLTMAAQIDSNAPPFLKMKGPDSPSTIMRYRTATPKNVAHVKNAGDARFFQPYLEDEVNHLDALHGSLVGSGQSTSPEQTEWFQRELAFGSSASKFHLPSLGTMAVAGYTFKNITENLQQAAKDVIFKMAEFIENSEKLPKCFSQAFDPTSAPLNLSADDVNHTNPLFYYLADALVNHPEYKELRANYGDYIPDEKEIISFARGAYKREDNDDAAHNYTKAIIRGTGHQYGPGMPVAITKRETIVKVAKNWTDYDPSDPDYYTELVRDSTWVITTGRGSKKSARYDLVTLDEYGGSVIATNLSAADFKIKLASIEDEAIMELAAAKKKALIHPASIVFIRIFLDVLFSIEGILYAGNVPSKFYQLSKSINVTNKRKAILNRYPNMKHVFDNEWDENFIKDKTPLIDSMVNLRTAHTIAYLANIIGFFPDNKAMDEFYKNDLRLSEVTWLARALTDEGKVVFERKETPNLLAQLQYRSTGVGEGVSAEAPVNAETVFYQMDSPILKDVIMKYDQMFIEFTITNAYMPKGKKKKKDGKGGGDKGDGGKQKEQAAGYRMGELASAVWGSIERRSADIVNRPGVKPHLLFNALFRTMENATTKIYTIRDNYPTKWVGTNTVTMVRTDPNILGEKFDMKFYSDRMDEYVKHLRAVYKPYPIVPIALLAVMSNIIIDAEGDVDTLREAFVARVKSQAARPRLKGTDAFFDPYRVVISIMRSEIDIPLRYREDFVARKLDETQRLQIKETFTDRSSQVILPETHPKYKDRSYEVDPESALVDSINPKNLPLPDYYPVVGATLNTRNPEVVRLLTRMVGDRLDPNFPPHGLVFARGSLTREQSLQLKALLLDTDTVFTALPIDWKSDKHVWDGRDSVKQKPHPSVVSHYRNNLGIAFRVTNPGYGNGTLHFDLEILPSNDLTNYNSILYKKYLVDKFDKASYVYIPPGSVFHNPYQTVSYKKDTEKAWQDPFMVSDDSVAAEEVTFASFFGEGDAGYSEEESEVWVEEVNELEIADSKNKHETIVYHGQVSAITDMLDSMGVDPEVEVEEVEIVEPRLGAHEDHPLIIEPTETHRRELDRSSAEIRDEIKGVGEKVEIAGERVGQDLGRLSSSVDLAASEFGVASTKFEGAAGKFDSAAGKFEEAGKQFSMAGEYFKQSAEEFAKLPEAIKEALENVSVSAIATVEEKHNVTLGTDETDPAEAIAAEEALEEIIASEPDPEGQLHQMNDAITLESLSAVFPEDRYMYRKLQELQPIWMEHGDVEEFNVVEATSYPNTRIRGWVRASLQTAVAHFAVDQDRDYTSLSPKEKMLYKWRGHCIGVIGLIQSGNYADARRNLGVDSITDEPEEPEKGKPTESLKEKFEEVKAIEDADEAIAAGKELVADAVDDAKEALGGALKKLKRGRKKRK